MIGKSISRLNRRRRRAADSQRLRRGVAPSSVSVEEIRRRAVALTNYLRDADAAGRERLGLGDDAAHRLIPYVADAVREADGSGVEVGEKVDRIGYRNIVGDDFEGAQRQIQAVMAQDPGGIDPLEHYVLSWREGERPSPEQLEESVDILLETLGLQENQTIFAAHRNTAHYHVHVAVNRVHPVSFRRIAAGDDWEVDAIHQAIALIEHRQGWASEVGALYEASETGVRNRKTGTLVRGGDGRSVERKRREPDGPDTPAPKLSDGARTFERRTGRASFERQAKEILPTIVAEAANWRAFHARLAGEGLGYERHRSGAHLTWEGRGIPATRGSRDASVAALERRFGAFEERPDGMIIAPRASRYLRGQERRGDYDAARDAHLAETARLEAVLVESRRAALRTVTAWRQSYIAYVDAHDWRGNRDGLNLSRQLVASHVAAFIAGIDSAIRSDLTALRQARTFPSYPAWLAGATPPVIPSTTSGVMLGDMPDAAVGTYAPAGLTARRHGRTTDYLDPSGRVALRDLGALIVMRGAERDTVRAGLEMGIKRWKRVEVGGGATFLAMAASIAVDEGWQLDGKEIQRAIAAERARRRVAARKPIAVERTAPRIDDAERLVFPERPIDVPAQPAANMPDTASPAVATTPDAAPDPYAGAYGIDVAVDRWIDHARREPEGLAKARALAATAMSTARTRGVLEEFAAEGYGFVLTLRQQARDHERMLMRAARDRSLSR